MGTFQNIEKWSMAHNPRWLVFIRVALGISLLLKGVLFISNTADLGTIISGSAVINSSNWLGFIITWAHLFGGFLIIIGLLTRWAVLINIPILIGAILFVNAPKGVFAGGSELGFSIIVLLLLLLFFVEGGGHYSLDRYFQKKRT
jgi:putative oxidoreductase